VSEQVPLHRDVLGECLDRTGSVLAQRGFNELPGIFPRWELTANDSYGTSPGDGCTA
jgi:hypothetical protein